MRVAKVIKASLGSTSQTLDTPPATGPEPEPSPIKVRGKSGPTEIIIKLLVH